MNRIRIFNEVIIYEKENLKLAGLSDIKHDDAQEILFKAKELLDEAHIDFYLGYGTLLGAIRENDFIKGDLDVDIFVKDDKALVKKINHFQQQGLKLVRVIPHVIYSFRLNDKCFIDMYVWGKPSIGIWRLYCDRIDTKYVPSKLLKGEKSIVFLGEMFKTVGEPIELLKFWYGDTWNVPIGKFDKKYYYEVKSHYYYKSIFTYFKKLLKRVIGEQKYDALRSAVRNED